MSRKTDEYGFPIPEGFDDEPKPAPPAPRVAPLVVLPLLMIVATGVASAIKYWPQWLDRAEQFAQAFDRRSGALEQAEHRIRHNPNDLRAYLLRGEVHMRRGNYAQAIPDYERVLEEFPADPDLNRRLATALNNFAYERALAGEDLPQALEDVQRAIELVPDNAAFLDTRGYLCYLLGDYAQAERDLDEAVRLAQLELREAHPRAIRWNREALAEILGHRALLYEQLGRHEEALRDRRQMQLL